jgi:polyphosphate kinase
MTLPFDGAISKYFHEGAPKDVRKAIEKQGKDDILNKDYPYREDMTRRWRRCKFNSCACRLASRQRANA